LDTRAEYRGRKRLARFHWVHLRWARSRSAHWHLVLWQLVDWRLVALESAGWKLTSSLFGSVMRANVIFDRILPLNLIANTAIFYVAVRLYLLPLLTRVRPQQILVPILLLHSTRHLGMMFLTRGATFPGLDRKSTRLNSSHVSISYAVFCLKKKKTQNTQPPKKLTEKEQYASNTELVQPLTLEVLQLGS